MTVDLIKSRIRQFRQDRGLSAAALARLAGLHENALRSIDDDNWNPRSDTLEKLEGVVMRAKDGEAA
jgi:ribosome-binding protein aMBF1 (putative translation factor)